MFCNLKNSFKKVHSQSTSKVSKRFLSFIDSLFGLKTEKDENLETLEEKFNNFIEPLIR